MSSLDEPGRQVFFEGFRIDLLNSEDLVKIILHAVETKRLLRMTRVNPHIANLANTHTEIPALFNQMDVVNVDGFGVQLAIEWLYGEKGFVRAPGDVFLPQLFSLESPMRIYLLGSTSQTVSTAATRIETRYPWISIIGFHHGYFSAEDDKFIRNEIRELQPDIVLVGMGRPKEVEWVITNSPLLPPMVFVTVGGYFDHISRRIDAYPQWAYRYNLNWLYRLAQEPRRLWKRYLLGNPYFVVRVLWKWATGTLHE